MSITTDNYLEYMKDHEEEYQYTDFNGDSHALDLEGWDRCDMCNKGYLVVIDYSGTKSIPTCDHCGYRKE